MVRYSDGSFYKAGSVVSEGLADNVLISHSSFGSPHEKFLAILIGQAADGFAWQPVILAVSALLLYLLLFVWYIKQMKKRNAEYAKRKELD